MNYANIIEQLMGNTDATSNGTPTSQVKSAIGTNIPGIAGGVAAGGLLALLVGNKKVRKQIGKVSGGAVGLGASAALGALAHKAYSSWQTNQAGPSGEDKQTTVNYANRELDKEAFVPANQHSRDGTPFELALVKAMIAAANADGHIDKDEHKAIFNAISKSPMDKSEKAVVIDTLMNPPSIDDIASFASDAAQASELYLASCLVLDVDHPEEVHYLEEFATKLSLPSEFVQHLNSQASTDNASLAA